MLNDKYKQILGYTPSVYQFEIFNFVEHGIGNGAIRAYAGSGKTATMIANIRKARRYYKDNIEIMEDYSDDFINIYI